MLLMEMMAAANIFNGALSGATGTANCIMIDHFSAFEPGLVAPLLYLRDKTAGFEPKRPEI